MNRGFTLPGACKNLSDRIRVLSLQGQDLGVLTVAEAQSPATAQNAVLVELILRPGMHVFRLVDATQFKNRPGKK